MGIKMNILFIVLDCLRTDKLSGETKSSYTPNLDNLLKKSTVFTQAIASTSTTTPSFGSILTGLYPFNHGIRAHNGYRLNEDCVTLGEILKNNGYSTYAEMTGPLYLEIGLNRGFDEYCCRERRKYWDTEWGESLIDRLRNKNYQKPFFLFLHLFELHHRRRVPKEFDKKKFGKNRYERALSGIDLFLGELFKCIDFNDTIIVLTGDHGEKIHETVFKEYLGDIRKIGRKLIKALGIKSTQPFINIGHGFQVFDYLIRVPLVFYGEKIFPPKKLINDQVRQVDILPTIVEALQLKGHKDKIDGKSLIPLVAGKTESLRYAHCEAVGDTTPNPENWLTAIRTSRYKLIYGLYNKKIPYQLFDLKNDPEEQYNLAGSHPHVVDELNQKIVELWPESFKELNPSRGKMKDDETEMIRQRLKDLGYID